MTDETGPVMRIPVSGLQDLLGRIFAAHGAPPHLASLLAANCAAAERDGAHSHGIFRVAGYISTFKSGYVDLNAQPIVAAGDSPLIRVDACNGFAQAASEAARPAALASAASHGMAIIAIRNSHHLGALWLDVEPYAKQGLIALSCVTGISRVAPFGGHLPFYGTDPFAFAAPRLGHEPLVFDQASSAMAYGDVKLAQLAGRTVPVGTGIDADRQPSADPAAILEGGALLPFGGHKGSSIAMMVELLAAGLTGADFSFQVDRSAHPGAQTSRSGQFLLLIDPRRGSEQSLLPFTARIEEFLTALRASGQQRLPGDRRYETRAASLLHGVAIRSADLAALEQLLVSG